MAARRGFQQFAVDLGVTRARLARLGQELAGEVDRELGRIAKAAAARARDLTPRSDGGGPHVGDGWQVARTPSGYIVRNTSPRGNEPIKLAGGGETNLLEILEFGSRPHEIRPRRPGGFLRFVDGDTGEVVYTRRVSHPGTRPYSMIGIAATEAGIEVKLLADALRATIRSRF